jgi:hypothetical protein
MLHCNGEVADHEDQRYEDVHGALMEFKVSFKKSEGTSVAHPRSSFLRGLLALQSFVDLPCPLVCELHLAVQVGA